ncbi:MAG: RdgB/HAM1 family non-canonical purine NTP pyrophosphatase [Treponema sp.]|nr:RdgB/HAM1 family non-canonical purine NTP pyrophosphatase [Treponema sp.]MCL2251168.1 RdgB/HAM1 family non-canonical purine NTP pyrophosphatase [Treponema sp.]
MKIWFATNNAHKKKELSAILGASLLIPSEEGLIFDPEETGATFSENALLKAQELKKILITKENCNTDLVIADDSGLCVDALGGRPGVLSARYGQTNGKKLESPQRNLLLLDELGDNPIRSAYFVCAMALVFGNDRFIIVQETLTGHLVKKSEIRGDGGFGYDPIFFLPEFNRTLAELSAEEKNKISHRAKAGKLIAEYLK